MKNGEFEKVIKIVNDSLDIETSKLKHEFEEIHERYILYKSAVESNSIGFQEVRKLRSQFKLDFNRFLMEVEIELQNQNSTKAVSNVKKILFFSANPTDKDYLEKLNDEKHQIEFHSLKQSSGNEQYKLEISNGSTVNDFIQDFNSHKPNILHFAGHSNGYGIVLINNKGKSKIVKTRYLVEFFKQKNRYLNCIVFNSCLSATLGKDISQLVGNVIAMNDLIEGTTALTFATGFYSSLFSGNDTKEAFFDGKSSIGMNSLPGANIPVLFQDGKLIQS
ncbi:MAG: hypothetical protein AAF717_20370 [Bacteroidota bacterium]